MRNVEFRINGQTLDTYQITSSPIAFRRRAEVLTDLSKRDGDTTIQFALPKTVTNRKFFGAIADLQAYAKFYTAYPFNVDIVSNGIYIVRNGRLTVEEITKNEYKCRIVATNINWANAFRERTLRDIQSLRRLAYTGLDTVITVTDEQALSFANTVYTHCDLYDVCFPLAFYAPPFVPNVWTVGNRISRTQYADATYALPAGKEIFGLDTYRTDVRGNAHFSFDSIPPAVYLRSIIRALFADIGYAVTGTILDDNEFRKLALLYTNPERPEWNWGAMGFVELISDGSITDYFDDLNYYELNTFDPNYGAVFYLLSASTYTPEPLVVDSDVGDNYMPFELFDQCYNAPANGTYEITLSLDGNIVTDTSPVTYDIYFIAMKADAGSQFAELSDYIQNGSVVDFSSPPTITFDPERIVVLGSLPYTVGAFSFSGTARIGATNGDQIHCFAVLVAGAGSATYIDSITNFDLTFNNVSSSTDLNPAAFLQTVKQADFIKDVAGMFNLFFDVDEENKTVYIDTYDRFFQNLDTAVDITELVDQQSFVSKPLPQNAEYNFIYPAEDDALSSLRQTVTNTRQIVPNLNQYGTGSFVFTPKTFGAVEMDSFQIVEDTAVDFLNPTFETQHTISCPYITTKEKYSMFQNEETAANEYDWLIKIVKVKEAVTLAPTATIPFLINGAITFYDKVIRCVFDDTELPITLPLVWSLSWSSDYGLYKLLWQNRLMQIFTGELVEFETNIRSREYNQMTLRRLVKIENQLYKLNEISDFDPIALGITKIILIKQ